MIYAAPIWSNTAVTNVTMLQRVQNKCLRMIVNAGPRERNVDIHKRCNVKSIMNEIRDMNKNFYTNQISHLTELNEVFVYIAHLKWQIMI